MQLRVQRWWILQPTCGRALLAMARAYDLPGMFTCIPLRISASREVLRTECHSPSNYCHDILAISVPGPAICNAFLVELACESPAFHFREPLRNLRRHSNTLPRLLRTPQYSLLKICVRGKDIPQPPNSPRSGLDRQTRSQSHWPTSAIVTTDSNATKAARFM